MTVLNSPIISSIPLLFSGFVMTLKLMLGSVIISLAIGILFGILRCNALQITPFKQCISVYVFIVRSIPMYIHVLIMYFVIPQLIGINFSVYVASIIALGIYFSAYITEIVRCGINTISIGQWNACKLLGYSTLQSLRWVIAPQSLYNVLPALSGELDALLKSTSVLSTIGLLELTNAGNNIIARYMNPIPVYLLLACIYMLISACLKIVTCMIERRLSYDKG